LATQIYNWKMFDSNGELVAERDSIRWWRYPDWTVKFVLNKQGQIAHNGYNWHRIIILGHDDDDLDLELNLEIIDFEQVIQYLELTEEQQMIFILQWGSL